MCVVAVTMLKVGIMYMKRTGIHEEILQVYKRTEGYRSSLELDRSGTGLTISSVPAFLPEFEIQLEILWIGLL